MKDLGDGKEKEAKQQLLKDAITAGAIDVNIMAKVDKNNLSTSDEILPAEYSDALAALRGFANSNLESSIVFSAGYNPRLYNYIENFKDFYPDENNHLQKKIILKVSDYRSALIQGKLLAKKGLIAAEFGNKVIFAGGLKRAEFNNKDWYNSLSLCLSYHFGADISFKKIRFKKQGINCPKF